MRSTNNERGRRQTRTDLLVTGVSCVVRMRGCFRGAFDSHRRTTVHCGGADLKLTSPTSETIRQCCVQISTPLQWGRRLSTSETRASRESAACSSPLQWGRRLSTSETTTSDVYKVVTTPLASMGPTSFNVGDLQATVRATRQRQRASMGPTSFNVGDEPRQLQQIGGAVCFNGADVFQRRRPVRRGCFRVWPWVASMGPTSFNVGDSLCDCPEAITDMASMGPTSFNVGDHEIQTDCRMRSHASMGPTSFNVGDLRWRCAASMGAGCFNGADVFQRRRPAGVAT